MTRTDKDVTPTLRASGRRPWGGRRGRQLGRPGGGWGGGGAIAGAVVLAIVAAAFLLPAVSLAAKAAASKKAATQPAASLSSLEWLTGCWERRNGTSLVEEQWMAPRGAMMLGMSRTVRGDALVEYEQLRIYERRGKLVYAARPSGQQPAEFVSTEVGDSVVVFENSTHDFPQRIVYCRVGLDSLVARVEGVSKGKNRVVTFPYVHIACPSGGPSPTR